MDQAVLSLCFLKLEESLGFGFFSCFLGMGMFERDGKFRTTCIRALEKPWSVSSWRPNEMLESISHTARTLHICS